MLPYIEKAIEQGYGLILYNYNVTSVVMETKNNVIILNKIFGFLLNLCVEKRSCSY